jgi:hypothetical protein
MWSRRMLKVTRTFTSHGDILRRGANERLMMFYHAFGINDEHIHIDIRGCEQTLSPIHVRRF